MIKLVLKHTFIFTILLCLFLRPHVMAAPDSNVAIAIFPFSVYADPSGDQKIQNRIKNSIPLMISEYLEKEGAKSILVTDSGEIDSSDYAKFRELGIKLGVDYIIIGSVFIEGQGISIDAKMLSSYDKDMFKPFYAEADELENLLSATTRISKEITGDVFHKKIIIDIAVTGSKRVEADAILKVIKTKVGDIIKPENISKDLRNIYDMGYFDNVIVTKESLDNGVKIIFDTTEKSSVRKVKFKGNSVYKDEELSGIVDTRTGGILNVHKLNSDVSKLRMMYTEKNYHNCVITHEIIPLEHGQADIVFDINEGEKIRVEKISFEGNHYFTDKKIKKSLETSEKGFFSFFTSSGNLNETEVRNDAIRIESLYKNNGFIDTKVSDPIIDIGEKSISILFKIDEGAQYKIKHIDITGDLIFPKPKFFEIIQSQEANLYNREVIRKDILSISDAYSNEGFANVDIRPLVDRNDTDHTMTISFSIDKGEPVYFSRINISGNLKTRDKVIRREIKLMSRVFTVKKIFKKALRI
jgi:outer membrane protein insertion porin family